MIEQASHLVEKLSKFSPVASIALAAVLLWTQFVQHNTINSQTVTENQQQIAQLQGQVKTLQDTVAQQLVLADQVKNVKEQVEHTQTSVDNLASEVHQWQMLERRYHETSR